MANGGSTRAFRRSGRQRVNDRSMNDVSRGMLRRSLMGLEKGMSYGQKRSLDVPCALDAIVRDV